MIRKIGIALCALTIWGMFYLGLSTSHAAPPPDTIKGVVDYFYNGREEGPVLVDSKLCAEVQDMECVSEIDPASVGVGDTLNVWMQFFVPKEADSDDIMVEYAHEGVPRRLTPNKVEPSIRYRVINRYQLNKTGKWAIVIKKGTTPLQRFDVDVIEK